MKIRHYILQYLFFILCCTACKTRQVPIQKEVNKIPTTISEGKSEQRNDTVIGQLFISSDKELTTIFKPKQTIEHYEDAYTEIEAMLEGISPLNFKRAVFVSENAFYNDSLDYAKFNKTINKLTELCKVFVSQLTLNGYTFPDSIKLKNNYAIFCLMRDTVSIHSEKIKLPLYDYDFEDNMGTKNWSSTFTTKLLTTRKGNCHSLPYLYKILANELNTEAYLSLAPNHIYLKHKSKRLGWYNSELTSGEFPTDAWVKASGYITIEAIRSGMYMDTLSQKQSIALTLYDLAKGYSMKTGNYNDGFVIKCCDMVLKHHPVNINAMILKAETMKKQYDEYRKAGNLQKAQEIYPQMQQIYVKGLELGYREMPEIMYQNWLKSIMEHRENNINQTINRTFNVK